MEQKKNILAVIKLPPPINGVTKTNLNIKNSSRINNAFNIYYINHGLARENNDFGTFKITKLKNYTKLIYFVLKILIHKNIALCYITIAPKNIAFIKDSLLIILFKIFKKKIVIHLHGKGIDEKASKSTLWLKYYRFTFKDTYVICLCKLLRADIKNVYTSNPFIIPNGIIPTEYRYVQTMKVEKPVILFLSNYYEQKGLFDYLEALKILVNLKFNNFEGWIVGNETKSITTGLLQQKVEELNILKYVKIFGPKYDHEKAMILKSASILVFPTQSETFGLVNIEAMEAGLSIITTNEGCIPDIIEDKINGFIVAKKNPLEIASIIKSILLDPKKMTEISDANIEKFSKLYKFNIFEEKLISTFNTIISTT